MDSPGASRPPSTSHSLVERLSLAKYTDKHEFVSKDRRVFRSEAQSPSRKRFGPIPGAWANGRSRGGVPRGSPPRVVPRVWLPLCFPRHQAASAPLLGPRSELVGPPL